MQLNDQEQKNLDDLSKCYDGLSTLYSDRENRPLHVPHGVLAFSHVFFHEVFEDAARLHAEDVAVAARAAVEAGELDEDTEIGLDLEPLIRKTYEMVLLTGIEYGRRLNEVEQCRCIESVGDSVEQALHNGECGH